MPPDFETYSYIGVEPELLDRLARAYRCGLLERLAERQVVPAEELPRLVFVGRVTDPEPVTRFETSQGTQWYLGILLTDEADLASTAYDFGRSDGDDDWF